MSVYFVTAREVDLVKIGYAYNPVARFHTLRTSSPIELMLEGAIPGGYGRERAFHQRFAKERMRGEWFRITAEIEEEIANSTRPSKFTWGAVKKWLHWLAEQEEYGPQLPPGHARAIRTAPSTAVQQPRSSWGTYDLNKLIATGDVVFPFRDLELTRQRAAA